ncbi:MAG: efflux RND transporter periplasmic adaptor subunit [Salibacteraceae bacterium]
MDKRIEKNKFSFKKWHFIVMFSVVLVGVSYLVFNTNSNAMYYPKDQLLFGTITQGPFSESISTNGIVIPSQTIQIDAFEGGVIEEIYAENGQEVVQGTPLLKLTNTALSLDFMNRETQIIEQINNLRNTRINLEQNKRNVEEQLVDITYELQQQEAQYTRDSALYAEGVTPISEFEASKNYIQYLENKQQILLDRTKTDEQYRASQLHRIDNSIQLMERNLEAVRNSLNQLSVTAPLTGQLNSFQHELGATIRKGESIGRIDILDSFHIRALVDQYYLNQIQLQQNAHIKLDGKTTQLSVAKIFPTVTNNQFEIHFKFQSHPPPNLRRGQSAPLKINLSKEGNAVLLPKGAFYSTGGGKYVFVVKGNEAHKTAVKLGRQNDKYIEVITGLQPNDQVIISPYTNFKNNELILIQ